MATSLDKDEFDAYLDEHTGWIVLSTITPDGYPHSVPLGYFRDGDRVYCGCLDGTTKIKNIERNPKVSMLIESGSTMSDIKGVMIQGTATVRRDADSVLALMRKGATRRGVAEADLPTQPRPESAYIEVEIERRISWDYGS
ncbi:MAG: pyridoxamine 5'-phosphate oxidase family protein [Ilumatobacteraceae bacterium]|nr:pyridoxamine 5'-phosphate oxidase family protein [Ilumatobacteraceae bacterium]